MSTTVSISTTASKRGSRKAASLARSISELPDGEHDSRESIAEEEEQEEPTRILSEILYDEYEEEKSDVDKWKEPVKPTDRPRRVLSLLERWRGWQVKFAIKEYIFSLKSHFIRLRRPATRNTVRKQFD
ncbi:uncharacterized protein LOC143346615 [Colletes latitarsis]|uniref:uncharacterized protein LOC143346615 n=1 Tax=Colletes latitarsis TaxID=2605962 RepID=UPI0040366E01